MSDHSERQVENDLISSIRRLVAEDTQAGPKPLVLRPQFRINKAPKPAEDDPHAAIKALGRRLCDAPDEAESIVAALRAALGQQPERQEAVEEAPVALDVPHEHEPAEIARPFDTMPSVAAPPATPDSMEAKLLRLRNLLGTQPDDSAAEAVHADDAPVFEQSEDTAAMKRPVRRRGGLHLVHNVDSVTEEALQPIVARLLREELQGTVGKQMTASLRKMVRRELQRALMEQDND